MFKYLAKCGWLFDGLFSHWLLNSSFASVEGFSEAALGPWAAHPGGRGPAPLPKILRLIVESLEFAN